MTMILRTCLLCVTILMLSACANSLIRKSGAIESGMKKQDVVRILGTASDKQFRGKDEAWQYCELGAFVGDFLVVWFYDGTVTGLTTYKDSSPSFDCTGQLRSIRWEDRPDTTIEIRKR
jgi:hypothetical protein